MNAVRAILTTLAFLVSAASLAQVPDRSRDNLTVVVRESMGANRPDDSFAPTGKVTAKLPDGRVIEMEMASWEYIGDTHIRFVFDGPGSIRISVFEALRTFPRRRASGASHARQRAPR